VASWQIAWARTDFPRARCDRALRVSVTPRIGLCCLSQPCPAVSVLPPLLAILSKPGAGMLQLRQGRSPSREAIFFKELDRSHPLRVAISSFKVALSRGMGGYRRGASAVRT
jgi:hypothetical protein